MVSDQNNEQGRFNLDMSPIRNFAREMDSFFNHSFKQMNSMFNLRPFQLQVQETDAHMIVTAELPGYQRDQIIIETFGNRLRIAVENKNIVEERDDKHKSYNNHQSYQKMERLVTLPFEIPEQETKASFKDGLLKLMIPKQNSKRKFIDIDD